MSLKVAFSNIAFPEEQTAAIFPLLRRQGVTGIEVAPTRLWPGWQGASPAAARLYRERLEAEGFAVPAFQAVLFAKPEARLFDEQGEAALFDHLRLVARLAGAMGAAVVVWGAPKQRLRGALSFEAAVDRAVSLLRRLGATFADEGSCLCVEPNPRAYGCDFVTNVSEGVNLVEAVDHPGFRLHLDAAGMFLEGDSLQGVWPRARRLVRHFHLSEPQLGHFRNPQVPHQENLRFLSEADYQGWVSVEMREPAEPLEEVGPWSVLQGALSPGGGRS